MALQGESLRASLLLALLKHCQKQQERDTLGSTVHLPCRHDSEHLLVILRAEKNKKPVHSSPT